MRFRTLNRIIRPTAYGSCSVQPAVCALNSSVHLCAERDSCLICGLLFQHPQYIWSEEYQIELFSEHFKAFDNLRNKFFFIGEMIWNFADFKTNQGKYLNI